MISLLKPKHILIFTLIILTLLLTLLVASVTEKEMRNAFMLQTQIGANAVDVAKVKNLTGTLADLKSPDYLQLKQQFANILKVDKHLHFVYLMGVKNNGKVFFYVDDKPDGSPECSPPGSPYDEAPKEFNEVMKTGIPVVQGPSADSWGSYASGCVPIVDPKTGKTIAIFAIDFATSSWYWEIVLRSALPAGLLIVLMLGIFSNQISKQRGRLLKKSEEKYRFMFDDNPQPNFIYDLETHSFLEVNNALINHYGYTKEEFLSMTLKDILPAEDIPILLESIKVSLLKRYNNTGVWQNVKKNGEMIYVEVISHLVNFKGKDARHVLIHDITDRKLAEEALKQANDELNKLHNNLNEAVFSVDMIQNKMIHASLAHKTVFGHSSAEFFENPKLWYEIIVPEDKSIVDAGYPVLFSGENLSHEYRIAHPNGEIHWIEAKINPTIDENGTLIRIDGIAYDITRRKQIETELLELEVNFRRSISESPVGIRIVSVDGDTVYANKAFLDIYEFNNLEEFKNTPAINRYLSESYVEHQERKKKRKEGIEVFDYEITIRCKNNETRHVKVSRKEVLWNGIPHFQVINQNITEQRNAEEELRKLSRAVDQSPNAECITDTDGIIEYINPITIKLTGYTKDELLGQKSSIFSSGEKTELEYGELWKTIKSGDIWKGELHNKKKNGELYWESTTISPIFDNQGKITHFLAIKVDISEQKRVEKALLDSKEQLRKFASHLQSVREEEKVALAREIHDELGQILVALKIDMGLLKKAAVKENTFSGSEDTLEKFDNLVMLIDKTIKTARRIMNGLRPELLEMHGLVGATKEYLREFEERHQISCEFTCNTYNLELTSQQSLSFFRILQEAMNNIVKHAKATSVKISLQDLDNKLSLEIIDNGVGFDQNNSGRDDSYGMLGINERVILLSGKLFISSEVGHGTTVKVEMPYVA
jgi:PAS domain S-box-containing protein